MVTIELGGKTHKLEMTLDSIEFLEEEFDRSIFYIFNEVDITRQKNLRKIYQSMLMNDNPKITEKQVKELIRKAVQDEETDLMELIEKVAKAFEESQTLKKAVEEGKKIQQKNNLKKMNA